VTTSATIITTARILDSGRERRIADLVPEPLVASCLMSDSAGCIIVTIGLPDPNRIVLKPQPELYPYICRTQLRVAARENLGVGRAPLRRFSALTQMFATGTMTIFGADDILAKHSS
jgi:hypothetical protein